MDASIACPNKCYVYCYCFKLKEIEKQIQALKKSKHKT